jgi:hypothetical protein
MGRKLTSQGVVMPIRIMTLAGVAYFLKEGALHSVAQNTEYGVSIYLINHGQPVYKEDLPTDTEYQWLVDVLGAKI